MATKIFLSKPSAVIPVANVFVAGLLQSAAQARFDEGAEAVRLDYAVKGEAKSVMVDPRTDWEVSVTDAWDLVTDTEVDAYADHVRETGYLDAGRALDFIEPSS